MRGVSKQIGKVQLEFLSGLAHRLGIEERCQENVMEAAIEGDRTVRDLLSVLATRYLRFGQVVFDIETRKLPESISVFLNGRLLELMDGLETKLKDGDILTLVEPLAGG